LKAVRGDEVRLGCVYSGKPLSIEAASIVMVGSRLPQDEVYQQLASDQEQLAAAGIKTLKPIGDCHGPATIAAAVYEGHRFARELGEPISDIPYEREITELAATFKLP
jgi:dimethylamine/trimethylamine dehydrogenase